MTHLEERRPLPDKEEAVAFKELGRAIATLRERRSMAQADRALRCEMTQGDPSPEPRLLRLPAAERGPITARAVSRHTRRAR